MKYISRITALLLVLMMLTPTFASALTLSTATQGDLDKLYQEASEDGVIYQNAGLLGDWSELSAFGNLAAKELYSFQWFNEAGQILPCFNDPWVVRVANTMAEQKFYCVATAETGNELLSPVYMVPAADISNLEDYVSLLYDSRFLDALGAANTLTIYRLMTDTWNVAMPDGNNLAECILNMWWSEREETYFDPYLLCSCVVSGAVAADECVLHPNSDLHVNGCSWKQPEISVNADVSTPESLLTLASVVLAAEERADVETYAWQNYIYDPANVGMRWAVVEYVQDTNIYTVQINKESIQTAYRVVIETTDYNVFESKPFYLGGYDFFNWILTNADIQAWMADDSVTLADVVARYNTAADEEDRTNAEDYTYGEEGESVNLKVPQGAFAEDYVMEIAQVAAERVAQLQNAVMAQLDGTGTHVAQVLMALDISFASLANRANKLQPNAPVTLTFEIDTTGLDEALKYLYVYHIANDGTPEVVTGPIDATFGVQDIVVDANAFSEYLVMATNDECAYCTNHFYCVYSYISLSTLEEQYVELNDMKDTDPEEFALFIEDYERHIALGETELLCNCDAGYATIYGLEHAEGCPWRGTVQYVTGVLGYEAQLNVTGSGSAYMWYKLVDGAYTPMDGETSNEITVVVTQDEEIYRCAVTLEGGGTAASYETFSVSMQTTVMLDYLAFLESKYNVIYDMQEYALIADYYINDLWNIVVGNDADGNDVYLSTLVLEFWNQIKEEYYYEEILCSCVVNDPAAHPEHKYMLPWDANHDLDCPWYTGSPVVELRPEMDAEGNVVSYVLCFMDENYEEQIVAKSTLMRKDENSNEYHYFQDVNTGWYVAYLHEVTNEDGTVTQWIIPLPSEKDLNN